MYRKPMRLRRWWCAAILAGLMNGALLAYWADWAVSATVQATHDEAAKEQAERISPRVALVLGTAPNLGDGRPNAFYWQRLRAAADLSHRGAVRGILVSGDNGRMDYDEPSNMRRDLHGLGVPLPPSPEITPALAPSTASCGRKRFLPK